MTEAKERAEQPLSLIDRLTDDAYNRFLSRETIVERVPDSESGSEIETTYTLARAIRDSIRSTTLPIGYVAAELVAKTLYTTEDAMFVPEKWYGDWENIFEHIAVSVLRQETIQRYPDVSDLDAIRQGVD